MKQTYCVVTFHVTQHALIFESLMMNNGIETKLMPTPRQVSTSCGTSARVPCELEAKILELCKAEDIPSYVFEDGTKIKTEGIFVAQGVAGSTDFAKKLGVITKNDKIVVNENMETNIKGIYACGDCIGGLLQVSKAVYDGAKAGMQIIKYIREKQNDN